MKVFIIILIVTLHAINSIAGNIFNVKDFGAKGNGFNDDTKAIQLAINKASPLLMATIYFPKGTYNIDSYTITKNYLENYCIKLHSNLSLKGDGDLSIIRLADHIFDKTDTNANAHIFYGLKIKNVSFISLMIDMNGINNLVPANVIKNHSAIFTAVGENYLINNITIKNCSGTNMLNIMGKGNKLVIENSRFINGGNYVGYPETNKNQIDFSFVYTEWDNTTVKNNIIRQNDIDKGLGGFSGGIEIHGSQSFVSDNQIDGCWPGIYLTSIRHSIINVVVKNNKLINCVTGIFFWVSNPMRNISILNNYIQLTYARSTKNDICAGIRVPYGNADEYNKDLANAAPLYNLHIIDNTITADTMSTLSMGMILHSLHQSIISGNIIKNMNYGGIVLQGSKWGTDSLSVENNTFTDFMRNTHEKMTAGYVVITDTYSPRVPNAPGIKNVLFTKNKFVRTLLSINRKKSLDKISRENFFGIFVALTKSRIEEIKFENNEFADPSEGIRILKTD